jgi:4-hydroxybenzoate polyprenyltransferase
MRPASNSTDAPLALAQLLRLPNVFTAIADVLMGYLVTLGQFRQDGPLPLLVATSCGLYLAGMVLNDVFDRERDALERPERPIPSGRVSVFSATLLGWLLLAIGVVCGVGAGYLAGDYRPAFVAVALAALVVAYDGGLKRTPLGPPAMGGCRLLNVLLGMSVAAGVWQTWHYVLAGGMGVYISGVTLFARTEATTSRRTTLTAGVIVMTAGLVLAASYPWWDGGFRTPQFWWVAWAILLATVLWRCVLAIQSPSPALVQAAVRNCLVSIIVIDAVLALPAASGIEPVWIVVLLAPTQLLGRWVYST